ncbi:MAG: GntR family transcriptional regulator [Geosporobacter ferrireducens]|nr:GntR family transcriptional regulator [Geosporobacter ferrireducens]
MIKGETGMSTLNKDSYLPYYLQIKDILKERIMNKAYHVNMLIPSENDLCGEFHVTRATIRNALNELKKEGLIYTAKGKGSIVSPPKIEQSLLKFYSFGREFSDTNETIVSKFLNKAVIGASPAISRKLNTKPNTEVFEIIRVRIFNDLPLILETSYIPVHIAPDMLENNMEEESIYDLLESKYGVKIVKAKEYIEPQVSNDYESKYLDIVYHSPVFYTERISLTYGEKPIELRKSIIRGDKFKFYTELY